MIVARERDRAGQPGGVAGPGREDDAADVGGEHLGRRGGVGQHPDADAASTQRPDDVGLEPEVDDGDQRLARLVAHLADGRRRHLGDEVLVLPARHGAGEVDGRVVVGQAGLGDHAPQAAVRAEVAGEGARVDAGDGRDVVAAQQRRELARVVEDRGRRVGDDEPAEPRPFRLVVVAQPAVVADQRVGHDDDLAGVRGIGGDLLVAGLRGVDDEVAARGDRGAEGDAREHRAVLEREERGTGVADAGIDDRVGAGQRRMRNGRWGDHGVPGCRGGWLRRERGERAPRAGMRTSIWPPTRPLRTGRPASQDRRSGCPDDSTWAGRERRPSGAGRPGPDDRSRPSATKESGPRPAPRSPAPPPARPGTRPRSARGWRRRSGRRGGPRSSSRSRARGPCHRTARPAPARTGRRRAAMSSGRGCPGPRRPPRSWRRARPRRTDTVTEPPRGLCRTALSTRIVTSWRRRAGSPTTIAGSGSTWTLDAARPRPSGRARRRPRRPRRPGRAASAPWPPRRSRSGRAAAGRRPAR